jgi:superoxide dismutase, Cu-Zn family
MKHIPFAAAAGLLVLTVSPSWAANAQASIQPTSPELLISGTVKLEDTPKGLKVDVEITRAPAGPHAFHIHEFGSCDEMGKAAGSHYNPKGHAHGNTLKDGVAKAHAGDFGTLAVDASGKASLQAVVPGLALTGGTYPVAGRSFVLHEKGDDFSQPTGNAGGRIGCGPILITASAAPAASAPAASAPAATPSPASAK